MDEINLTTAELVKALRRCATGEGKGCADCNVTMTHNKKLGCILGCAESLQLYAAERLEALEKELQAAKAMAEEIAGDFVDYVCTGTTNPAPYCKNKCEGCTDKYGMCAGVKCIGFAPKAWREEDEAD